MKNLNFAQETLTLVDQIFIIICLFLVIGPSLFSLFGWGFWDQYIIKLLTIGGGFFICLLIGLLNKFYKDVRNFIFISFQIIGGPGTVTILEKNIDDIRKKLDLTNIKGSGIPL